MRILFVSDLHSSLNVWEQALKNANSNNADILILSGDHTGKYLIPIIETKNGWRANFGDNSYIFNNQDEVESFKEKKSRIGVYSRQLSAEEIKRMQEDENYFSKVFDQVIIEKLKEFLDLINNSEYCEKLNVLVSPGNDDPFFIDEILTKNENVNFFIGIENTIKILNYTFVNFEYTQPTPWETPRELSEKEITKRVEKLLQGHDLKNLIFNFHCPPYNTLIDKAPKLDKNLKPVVQAGQIEYDRIGSKSIKKLIEKYQPICSFHGHVHESPGVAKIGNTLCFNPGSEYDQGIFRGYIAEIDDNRVIDSWSIIK